MIPLSKQPQNLGLALIILAGCVDSLSGLFTRLVTTDTWTMIFWRGIFAAVFVLFFAALRYRGKVFATFAAIGWVGLLLALINAAGMVAGLQSMRTTAVANFFIIFATAPFAAALLARVIVGERLDAATLAAALFGFCGVFIMMAGSAETGKLTGDLLACAVVVSYSILVLIVRRANVRSFEPIVVLTVLASSLLSFPLASPAAVSLSDIKLLILFGFIQLGLGNILIFRAARLIPAAQSGLLGVLNCALAPFWMWLFLGEIPPPATIAGGSIVMFAALAHLAWQVFHTSRVPEAPAVAETI